MPPASTGLLPYPPRPGQRELIEFLSRTLRQGAHGIAQSGTGTGKTVSALAAALPVARDDSRRILYLTRTNSQARQVMREYRAIRKLDGSRGVGVAMQGRASMCPLRAEEPEMQEADAEELGVMCRDRMRGAEDDLAGRRPKVTPCHFHARGLRDGPDDLVAWAREEAPDAEALAARVTAAGQCPYVLTRKILPEAELVVAPYVYFFAPPLRSALLQWMGAAPHELMIIVDEAHNLPDFARDLATGSLSHHTLALARRESRDYGDPDVMPGTKLTTLLRVLEESIEEARREYVPQGEEDALLPPDEFDVLLLSSLRTSTPGLDRAVTVLEEYGAAVRETKRSRGRLPRSYVGAVGTFLRAYRNLEADTHVRLIEVRRDDARLTAYAVDPTPITNALLETAGSLHMSGTLVPLEEYRDTIGLARDSPLATFPSPFPPENRRVLIDDEVTTRHEDVTTDPSIWEKLRERIREIRAATDRNIAIFAPSHETLRRLAGAIDGRAAYVERQGDGQREMMARLDEFRGGKAGTLAAVVGGRLSEGLDFPDDELEVVVIVGLPYGKPSAKTDALIRFHERRSGRGWEYAVKVPMVRRVLQTAGRLIRTPTDRGVVILLDRRAAMLRDVLPEALVVSDPAAELERFFSIGASRKQ